MAEPGRPPGGGGAGSEGLGRSRGGFTSKLHLSADGRCRPLSLIVTAGQEKIRILRIGPGAPRKKPTSLAADKAYSNGSCRDYLRTANGEQCDEYPFRTTLEGAANPDWDFSVRAVNGSQNGSAGQTLMVYMRNHRILAWDDTLPADYNDRFYVQIVNF